MQKITLTRLFVLLALVSLLSAGCAKKAAQDESQMTEGTQAVEETQMQDQQISAVEEQQVSDVVAGDTASGMQEAVLRVRDLSRIYFDFDQYVLTKTAQDTLYANAQVLKAAPEVKIVVEGHCDERGSDEYNLALGEKRAVATKNYLISLGVPAEQMGTISYGEEVPLDMGHSEEAWAKNRRAEFTLQR
ncbi:MAG TPA: peptidoglycan-associated lipoprotein Pal [Geopsychrobacteraceae bacterium]|nr:peptidoglycan-associated lipoprotein Pal [Geopsychrobacteraceae bacterium]